MMNKNKFLFLVLAATSFLLAIATSQTAFAQQAPPLEKPTTETQSQQQQSLGKITIQISQTEQIIIDLPIKSENKYQVIPIK
jgi:biopolymer transport protein ExbD